MKRCAHEICRFLRAEELRMLYGSDVRIEHVQDAECQLLEFMNYLVAMQARAAGGERPL